MRDNRSFYSNWDWLSCLIYCCHSGVWGRKHTPGTDYAEIAARTVTDREALIVELVERAREVGEELDLPST